MKNSNKERELTSHERIVLAMSALQWLTKQMEQLRHNFIVIAESNNVGSNNSPAHELLEEYESQLAEIAYTITNVAQETADFMNDHDSVDNIDQEVLNGIFKLLITK